MARVCRRETERQRDLVRRSLLWSFGPLLLALGTIIFALALVGTRDRGILPNGLPFLCFVGIWIVAYFVFGCGNRIGQWVPAQGIKPDREIATPEQKQPDKGNEGAS